MDKDELIAQLSGTQELTAQKSLVSEHIGLVDDHTVTALKDEATQLLRADITRSLQFADLVYYIADLTDAPLHRALGLVAEANVRVIGQGQHSQGIELYNEAAQIYESLNLPVEQARAQIGKLWALASLGRYDEALETAEWASAVLEAKQEWLLLARLSVNRGIIHGRMGNDAAALSLFDKARSLYHELGEVGKPFIPRVEYDRAIVLRNLGQFKESIQASENSLALLENMGQMYDTARAKLSLALTYFVMGRYNETLILLEEILETFIAGERQRDAILVQLFISDCLLQLRRFSDVLEKCQQVRQHFTEQGTRYEVAQAILNEAIAHVGLGHDAQAQNSLREARQIFEQEQNEVWVASTDLEQAALNYRMGYQTESLSLAQAAATVFQSHDQPHRQAQAQLIAARAAFSTQQYEYAQQLIGEAMDFGQRHDLPVITYQAHYLSGQHIRAQGDSIKALSEHDHAIQELERLRGRLMIEYRVDFLEDKQGIYEDAVRLCLDIDQPARGLEYAERAKSRALLDLVAYRLNLNIEARSADDLPLVEELQELRAERDRIYRRWAGDEDSKERGWSSTLDDQGQARQDVLRVEKQIKDLWHKLLVRNADYARDASLWHVRTEPAQPHLSEDSVLIEYFTIHGALVAFLVTPDNTSWRPIASDLARVNQLLQLLWLNIRMVSRTAVEQQDHLTANAQQLLSELYQILIEPIAEHIAGFKKVIIVPHGPLHYLPFHALHNASNYLIEQFEISYLPASSLLRYCLDTRHDVSSDTIALGYSYNGKLPFAVQEAQDIARLIGARSLIEEQVTLGHFQDVAAQCNVIHLATHGEFRPDDPLFSGLKLDDGWLTTLDIFNMKLHTSLVTLSACQTGQSVIGSGDELLGLMRAFLSAGSASLVLSLWAVEDRSTARLMQSFYTHLTDGQEKGAALRSAQLTFIQGADTNGERLCHPYFWAPFFLIGDMGSL